MSGDCPQGIALVTKEGLCEVVRCACGGLCNAGTCCCWRWGLRRHANGWREWVTKHLSDRHVCEQGRHLCCNLRVSCNVSCVPLARRHQTQVAAAASKTPLTHSCAQAPLHAQHARQVCSLRSRARLPVRGPTFLSPVTSSTLVLRCAAGRFAPHTNATTCLLCPLGKHAPQQGPLHRIGSCELTPRQGLSACSSCGLGTFNSNSSVDCSP